MPCAELQRLDARGRQGGRFSRSYFKLIKFILRYTTEEADLTGSRHRRASKTRQPGAMSHECTDTGSQVEEGKHTQWYTATQTSWKTGRHRDVIAQAIRHDAGDWDTAAAHINVLWRSQRSRPDNLKLPHWNWSQCDGWTTLPSPWQTSHEVSVDTKVESAVLLLLCNGKKQVETQLMQVLCHDVLLIWLPSPVSGNVIRVWWDLPSWVPVCGCLTTHWGSQLSDSFSLCVGFFFVFFSHRNSPRKWVWNSYMEN